MPVYAEFPLRIAKMWKDEEDKAKKETNGDADVEMDDAVQFLVFEMDAV